MLYIYILIHIYISYKNIILRAWNYNMALKNQFLKKISCPALESINDIKP